MGFRISRVIKYLILGDLIFFAGLGLISPIFAIFIVEKIRGGTAFVAGMASAIYLILSSLLRFPFGMFLDKIKGEIDDYWFVVLGFLISALVPIGYIYSSLPWHIYVLEACYGIGMAMNLSGWYAMFTRHIDKGMEATEWGIEAIAFGVGSGITGAIGGYAVTKFGFNPVFVTVSVMGLLGTILLLRIKNEVKERGDHTFLYSLTEMIRRRSGKEPEIMA